MCAHVPLKFRKCWGPVIGLLDGCMDVLKYIIYKCISSIFFSNTITYKEISKMRECVRCVIYHILFYLHDSSFHLQPELIIHNLLDLGIP